MPTPDPFADLVRYRARLDTLKAEQREAMELLRARLALEIRTLRAGNGFTFAEIGERLGVSAQRAEQMSRAPQPKEAL